MKQKLLALDLFCGGGGACIGMQRAGFEVIGVDIKPRPNYPGEHFILADLTQGSPVDTSKADFLWASPENVVGAPIRPDVVLTGSSVGLWRLQRRRHFETSFIVMHPPPKRLERWKWEKGIAGTITTSMCASSHFYHRKANGKTGRIPNWEAKEIMGIPQSQEMTNNEIGEAVPPAYSEYIAREALRQMRL